MKEQVVACLLALAVPSLHLQTPHQNNPLSPSDGVSTTHTDKQQADTQSGEYTNRQGTREHSMHT